MPVPDVAEDGETNEGVVVELQAPSSESSES